jgi:hypothetical protein
MACAGQIGMAKRIEELAGCTIRRRGERLDYGQYGGRL